VRSKSKSLPRPWPDLDQAADGFSSRKPPREMLHKREFTARLTPTATTPTATKNSAAIQTSEPERLPLMIAIKMIVVAIEHAKAIARLHQ